MIEVKELAKKIQSGNIVALKTDIGFELVCDATNNIAVTKIYSLISNRTQINGTLLLPDYSELEKILHSLPEVAFDLVELSDKPLTIIFNSPSLLSISIFDDGKLPVRIVKENSIRSLLKHLKKPMLAIPILKNGEEVCTEESQLKPHEFEVEEIAANVAATGKLPSTIELSSNGEVKIINH